MMRNDSFILRNLVAVIVVSGCIAALSDDPDWSLLSRVVHQFRGDPEAGDRAVLNALDQRAGEVLGRLNHALDSPDREELMSSLRSRLAESIGHNLLPKPMPRNVRRVGVIERGDYVIEKIIYETFPGTKVPVHVYRPSVITGKLPTLLFVPGHWWADSKTHPDFQSFCINLARFGFVVLSYDPIGQGERGISFRDHRRTPLLLFGISQQAIMVYESQCALEYLISRDDVDSDRIGITGASGGGYNSWTMTCLDDRIKVSVPVVGTSEFYGQLHACQPLDWYRAKEHCHFVPGLLRYANNHEFAALCAPRPVLVIAAHDDESFPIPGIRQVVRYGKQLYENLGHADRFSYFEDAETGHGYQKKKREAAYGWFRYWLKGEGSGTPIPEPATLTVPFDDESLRCFPVNENAPAGPGIMTTVHRLLEKALPKLKQETPEKTRRTLITLLGVDISMENKKPTLGSVKNLGSLKVQKILWPGFDGLTIPAVLIQSDQKPRGIVLAASDRGKESLLEHPGVRIALQNNFAVIIADIRGTGELAVSQPGWVFAVSLLLQENFVGRQALDLLAGKQALTDMAGLQNLPVGLLGVGPFASMAALYATVLDSEIAWLNMDQGFISFRSFIDRPQSINKSYALANSREHAWNVIDREIPHSLFLWKALNHFDLTNLIFSISNRSVLISRPINGDWQSMSKEELGELIPGDQIRISKGIRDILEFYEFTGGRIR